MVQTRRVPTERILALTFTDQAASQMKQKLEERLGHTNATILTFHRFCGRIVRENPLLAGVDPAFSLLDESAARSLLREQIELQMYEAGSKEVIQWAEYCGLDAAQDMILSVYESWRERAWDAATLREYTNKTVTSCRVLQWEEMQETLTEMQSLYRSATITAAGTVRRMQTIIENWNRSPYQLRSSLDVEEPDSALQAESALKALFGEVTRSVAKEAKPLFEKLAGWKKDRLWQDLWMDQTANIRNGLLSLLEQIDTAYKLQKQRNGWADFSDLQDKAYHVLTNYPDVRTQYGKSFKQILVDEYQDTSPIQQSILEALEQGADGTTSLFMVGDIRQSIYRFRGADVRGFEQMRHKIEDKDAYIQLRDNFRACPALVAFVSEMTNRMFGDGENFAAVGTAEEQTDSGMPGATAITSREEPEIAPPDESVVELLVPIINDTDDPRQIEADLVAQRIFELGPALWGDTAILMQTRTHLAKIQRSLEKFGIPHVVYAGTGYWERQEILDLFHLLRLVENPSDSIALLGYLRGPLVRLSEEGLWRISRQGGLRQGFLSGHETNLTADDASRLEDARSFLSGLRNRYSQMGLSDWVYAVLYEEGVAECLNGVKFDRIVQMSEGTEKRGEPHLSDLLNWWEQLALENDKGSGIEADESRGKVRIMTIHAAKGLEFPIVFVPDLNHRNTLRMDLLHLSNTWGLTAKYYDAYEKTWLPSLVYEKARLEERNAMIEEQKRLLYVAMTRAKEMLILSGTASAFTNKPSLEECSNWFDWLPFLIPALQEEALTERTIPDNGWGLRIRREVPRFLPKEPEAVRETVSSLRLPQNHRHLSRETHPVKKGIIPRMRSVTEWVDRLTDSKKEEGLDRRFLDRPVFNPIGLEAHEWGHVLHHVLEHISPDDDLNIILNLRLKVALASVGVTTSDGVEFAWERLGEAITAYVKSNLHREFCKAKVVYSEIPFAVRLLDEPKQGLFLNGVIDKVWLRADGGTTLVDFKTHKCNSAREVKKIVGKYVPQIQLYAHVVHKLLGWKVDRAGLYFTAKHEFIEVPCDSVAIERLIKRIELLWLDELSAVDG